jgi:hypothetical protein
MLGLAAQAEESQENPKCPDDPTGFKGKEDDCFDCLEGAFDKLKQFTDEVSKMLDNKKLTTAEESESLKTRGEGLWDGVEGWQKICEPTPGSKGKPKEEEGATPKAESTAEPEAETEENAETDGEPTAEEDSDTQAEAGKEAKPASETEPEEAGEKSEDETGAEPEPVAEMETEGQSEAGA